MELVPGSVKMQERKGQGRGMGAGSEGGATAVVEWRREGLGEIKGCGKGSGTAFGATTIVNAMPSGYGAALGVCLSTVAEVEILDTPEVEVEIIGSGRVDDLLAREAFRTVVNKFGTMCGGRIVTRSEIPPARGMKSSSAASNAVVIATLNAIGAKLDPFEVVRLGVEASRRAGVTATGAFDDACASLFGGVNLTNNYNMRLINGSDLEEELRAVFLVPEEQRYSGAVDMDRLRDFSKASLMAFSEAMEGRIWRAMIINGLLMARAFGSDPEPILEAVKEGAVSAGLSGKGPAYCAIV
ncbi:MAG: shikimate kinase, partial [Candidatus Verstraetearchaeota archaeon]|nr:shikimate kinase [Candidatus Verstraetearchaeota archaeon]